MSNSIKYYKAEDGYKSEDVLQAAYDHFYAASLLFQSSDSERLYDSAGYLLHLSIELLLKSWLLEVNGEFPVTHRLQHLRELVCKTNNNFNFTKEQNRIIEYLDKLYELRYPNYLSPTEIGTEDITLAKSVGDKIVNSLPESLYNKFEAIEHGRKSGRVLMSKPDDVPLDVNFIIDKDKT